LGVAGEDWFLAGLPAQADLDRYADAGTRAFLAAYGAN
jgi:hypothetical protein